MVIFFLFHSIYLCLEDRFVDCFPDWELNSLSVKVRQCTGLCFILPFAFAENLGSYSFTKDSLFVTVATYSPEVESPFVIISDLCRGYMSACKSHCVMQPWQAAPSLGKTSHFRD